MKREYLSFSLAAVALLAGIGVAQANTVSETYNFTLGNFEDLGSGNVPPPITSITGSFTLTFDPSLTYIDQSAGLSVNSFNAGSLSSLPLVFSNSPGSPYFISVGNSVNGADQIFGGTDDFVLQLRFADANSLGNPTLPICTDPGFSCGGNPTFYASGYTLASYSADGWFATSASVSATPLPASLALLGSGLGALGLFGWRRKKKVAAPAAQSK